MGDFRLIETDEVDQSGEDQWIALSDLMTGLMLIFMLLAIAYMMKAEADAQQIMKYSQQAQAAAEKITQVAVNHDTVKKQLYEELGMEFKDDFPRWGATLSKDLSIRFENPFILFNRGDNELKEGFKEILTDFFPRYLKIITSAKYRDSVQEIRIEGHTSSVWSTGASPQEAYFKNMELSQARTRTALRYIMELPAVQGDTQWLQEYVTANGLSSSQPIYNPDGTENEQMSQRVEFRIRTNAEDEMDNILQKGAQPAPTQ